MPKIVHEEDAMKTLVTFLISTRLKRAINERIADLDIPQSEYLRRLIQRDLNESGNE